MPSPPPARGRRKRLLRGEPPHDLLVVIRAAPSDHNDAVDDIAEDAELSARNYTVETADGRREILHGVSVFARGPGVDVAVILDRFIGAPAYLEVAVGVVRAAGFEVYATGANPDHFDIQLIPRPGDDMIASRDELRDAATRLLAVRGPLYPNPAYAGETSDPRQEDR